jgi:hypothetical protein
MVREAQHSKINFAVRSQVESQTRLTLCHARHTPLHGNPDLSKCKMETANVLHISQDAGCKPPCSASSPPNCNALPRFDNRFPRNDNPPHQMAMDSDKKHQHYASAMPAIIEIALAPTSTKVLILRCFTAF